MSARIVLITGASRGLGRSMALHLAREGAAIIGTYRERREQASDVAREIEALGGTAVMLRLDVGDSGSFAGFADEVGAVLRDRYAGGRLSALVHNAGLGVHAPYTETTEAQFDEMIRVHVKAPFFLTQALLPHIADGGRILNVSTGLARFTLPGHAAYASAKGAVEVLTRYMALELGGRGIRVNVVAPGAVASDFGGGMVRDNPSVNAHVAATVPLGRVGQPDDIGSAVAVLLSEGFAWANGTRIEVSGGQHL